MAKPEITKILAETDTFQIWLNKTNELVDILNVSTLTASLTANADVTNGDVILNGSFTANSITSNTIVSADVSLTTLVNVIDPEIEIEVNSPVLINGPGFQENLFEVKSNFGTRPIVSLTNGAGRTWNLCLDSANDSAAFVLKSGTANTAQLSLTQAGVLSSPSFQGNGSLVTNLNANNISSGTVPVVSIPNLDAGKITTGVFNLARIPSIDADRVPSLDASKITTGVLNVARIPDLDAAKITTGTLPVSRGGTGVATFTADRVLVGAGTSAVVSSGLTWATATNRLGVNVLSPTEALHVSGNILATANITAFSDARLKSNVETIDSALEKVNNLRGVYYTKDGARGVGVIAQEVEKIIPEVVFDGNEFKSVAYGNLVGLLIEAVKELTKEVETLKNNASKL